LGRWWRHASNAILSGGGCWPSKLFMTANLLGESYARYVLITAPGSLSGGLYGPWLGWTCAPIVAILAIFLPLYFPTGRLLSPRWRPVVWFGMGLPGLRVAGNALWPGPEPPLLGLAPLPGFVYEAAPSVFGLLRTLIYAAGLLVAGTMLTLWDLVALHAFPGPRSETSRR
jgi:hypothetical protein